MPPFFNLKTAVNLISGDVGYARLYDMVDVLKTKADADERTGKAMKTTGTDKPRLVQTAKSEA